MALQHSQSSEKGYSIMETHLIANKIMEENKPESMITALPEGCNLMLFYFCHFSKEDLANTLDAEQTGRKTTE